MAKRAVRADDDIREIVALRLLPPMGIARFGSSPEPMDNYTLEDPPDDAPGGFRRITLAETLVIDKDGAITHIRYADRTIAIDAANGAPKRSDVQSEVAFRDGDGLIKRVCPFFEVWAQFEQGGEFRPLTLRHLQKLGLGAGDVVWRVKAANTKVYRRTGQEADSVHARTRRFSDHQVHDLIGECEHFKPGKSILFGHVQYIRPRLSNDRQVDDVTSVIRARFTPGKGLVFGLRAGDPLTHGDVYWAFTDGGAETAGWNRYYAGDDNNLVPVTAPQDIYQGAMMGSTDDEDAWDKLSSGYFDDTCDGIIEVSIKGTDCTAYARFA